MSHSAALKILHLLSQRPDSTGSGIFVRAMLREAAARGHDGFLVAGVEVPEGGPPPELPGDRALLVRFGLDEGLPAHITGMSDVMPYESTRFRDLTEEELDRYEAAFAGALTAAVERFAPDVIHSHHLWLLSSLTRRLFPGIPLVTSCHGSDLRQFQNCPHLQERVLAGCRGIDTVVALSRAQRQEIIRLYGFPPERVKVAGAGYDHRLFRAADKPRPEPVQLVYAGKLSHAKGVPWLLRALDGLDSPDWQLHLLGGGSGPEKEHCLQLARQLGPRVLVHGPVPQAELAAILRQSHVLVLPSFFEGLPLVILEGLASGCRIVATELPGAREVLGGCAADFISLVPTPRLRNLDQPYQEDEEQFVGDLQAALAHQMEAARRRVRLDPSRVGDTLAAYTWTGVFRKYETVFQSLLS